MMDTKEALKELEDLTVDYGNRNEEQIARLDEAIDMAINALKAQADSDTISRRDAIDYCHQLINVEHQQGSDEMNYGRERVNQTETILHHLEIMPPAQPKERTEERTETHACDLIDGEAAVDAIEEMQIPIMRSIFPEEQFVFKGMSEALSAIKDLPSAQPEPHWIPFKRRKPTEEEGTAFDYIMDCKCPEDGQNILVSINIQGHEPVQYDTFYGGGGEECCLESGYELVEEAIAWMPLPEPYRKEGD